MATLDVDFFHDEAFAAFLTILERIHVYKCLAFSFYFLELQGAPLQEMKTLSLL